MTRPPRTRIKTRRAHPDDSAALARLHIASWRATYRDHLPQRYLNELSHSAWQRTWSARLADAQNCVILAEDTVVIGFVNIGASRDPDATPETGEIYSIYLHPDHWRKGIGTRLHAEALQALASRGFTEVTLWVLEGNRSARAFYGTRGWFADGHSKVETRGEMDMIQVRYRLRLPDHLEDVAARRSHADGR